MSPASEAPAALAKAEQLVAAYFCRLADTVGLPRTVALIYAALFLAEQPLCFADIVHRADLSKASASTGLRLLQRMRAIHVVVLPSDRRTYYQPETSLRRLIAGFLDQTLQPGLADSGRLLDTAAESAADPDVPKHFGDRIASLRRWHELAAQILPNISSLGSG